MAGSFVGNVARAALDNVAKTRPLMSTLTYSRRDYDASPAEEKASATPRKSFWRRAFESMITARQRRADREIAAYIASRGGHLTDEVERDMMRSLSAGNRVTRL